MVKLDQGLTLGVLLVVIVVMILKPNLLGFLYNNVLGKLIFVAAIVFLSLKHTAAGLLAVVFVAIVATMSGYYGFEGFEGEEAFEEQQGGEGFDEQEKEGMDEMQEGYEGEMQEGYEGEMQEGYEGEMQEGLCQGENCDNQEGYEGEQESFTDLIEGATSKGKGKRK
jgi:hypothetical protein